MKKFKEYVNETFGNAGYRLLSLHEELNDEQKKIVDSWGPNDAAKRISGHVIPSHTDRITIPLQQPGEKEAEPHPDVKQHLEKHGYSISDYRGGYANDKYGRQVSIGKVLNKTKAPKNVSDAFLNDPQRAASTKQKSGLKVIISRHPHDVCGMSTDRGWQSCMTMKGDKKNPQGGSYNHYLQNDVQQGTHVAYLVHHDDDAIKNPLARIALKPFHSDDGTHTILHPETRAYGTADSSFHHTVNAWASKHFPINDDKDYHRDTNTYQDSPTDTIRSFKKMIKSTSPYDRAAAFEQHPDKITKEHIDKAINDSNSFVREAAVKHPMATSEHIQMAMNDPDRTVVRTAVRNSNATPEQLHRAMDHHDTQVVWSALHNKNIDSSHIDKAMQNPDDAVREKAISHPKASIEQLNNAINGGASSHIVKAALNNPNITPEHINTALNHDSSIVRGRAAEMATTPENIDKALRDDHAHVRAKVASNPNASSAHISKALEDDESTVRTAAIRNPKATHDHLMKAVADPNRHVYEAAMEHPKIKPEHLIAAMDANSKAETPSPFGGSSPQKSRKMKAIAHPSANPAVIDRALSDKSDDVRAAAAEHPNASSENLHKALGDTSSYVRSMALEHPNITSEHIDKALNDSDSRIVKQAVSHDKAEPHHLEKAFNSDNSDIRRAAMSHFKASSDLLKRGMDDPEPDVRSAAYRNPKIGKEHLDKMIHGDEIARHAAVAHPNATHEHLMKGVSDPEPNVAMRATNHSNATPEHLEAAYNHPNEAVRKNVMYRMNTPESIIDKGVSDPSPEVRRVAVGRTQNPDRIISGFGDSDSKVRESAKGNDYIDEKVLKKAMQHPNPEVRAAAVYHRKSTPEIYEMARKDSHPEVRAAAYNSEHIKSEHIHDALNDPDTKVRTISLINNKIKPEHVEKALNDPDEKVRGAAIYSMPKHDGMEKHFEKAVNDSSPLVRQLAANHPDISQEHLDKLSNDPDEGVRKKVESISTARAAKKKLEPR